MEHSSEKINENQESQESSGILASVRQGIKDYKLASVLTASLGAASLDAQDSAPVVVRVENIEELNQSCLFSLVEVLSTIPDVEVKETWLEPIQKGKMRLYFSMASEGKKGSFARFSVEKENGKFYPRLDVLGPFIMSRDVSIQRKWSVILHEFVHYKQWLRGNIPSEFFLVDRNIGSDTWKEEARFHFDGEVEANEIMFAFLDKQNYDGYESVGRKDIHYKGWKAIGHDYIVKFVYENLVNQTKNHPEMIEYLQTLAKDRYSKKEPTK